MNDANVAMPSASPTWRTVVFVAARDAGLVRVDVGEDHVRQLRAREPDAEAEHDHARQQREERDVGGDHDRDRAAGRSTASASPVRTMLVMLTWRVSRPAMGAAIAMRMPCGSIHSPRAQRGEVLAVLQQDREDEQQAELAHREHHRGEQAVAEAEVAELAELEERVAVGAFHRPLDHDERGEHDDREQRTRTG